MSTLKKKTIQINPNFFSLNKKTKKNKKSKKKARRNLISSSLRPNNVKKQLLERIKKYQIKQKINGDKHTIFFFILCLSLIKYFISLLSVYLPLISLISQFISLLSDK